MEKNPWKTASIILGIIFFCFLIINLFTTPKIEYTTLPDGTLIKVSDIENMFEVINSTEIIITNLETNQSYVLQDLRSLE